MIRVEFADIKRTSQDFRFVPFASIMRRNTNTRCLDSITSSPRPLGAPGFQGIVVQTLIRENGRSHRVRERRRMTAPSLPSSTSGIGFNDRSGVEPRPRGQFPCN